MELKVYKDTVTAAESICDTKLELPVETEMLIPDYLPQVFKIVKCFVYLVVLQKQVTAGRLTVDGYLRCVVYYQSEGDESLCQAEQKLPFTKQVDVKPGSWGPATVLVSGETEYVNCRAVNQRRVDVRGAFALSIEAVAEAQGEVITALAGGGIQQRTTSLTGSKTVGSQEKLITAEESIAFDAPPEMVLSTQCTGAVNEVKLVSGKAVLKGEIRAEVVYRTAPGHTLVHTTRQIPFNEILDVEGAAEDCQCFAVVQPTGCTITGGSGEDEGENTISATAALYVKVYRPVEYMAVSDAFSTESETVLTQQQVALEEVADVFTQQVEAVTTGQLPDENARIIDVMATPLPMEVIEQDGEAVLRGRVMAHLLCINALEEIDCYDKVCEYTLPRRYPRPAGHRQLPLHTDGAGRRAVHVAAGAGRRGYRSAHLFCTGRRGYVRYRKAVCGFAGGYCGRERYRLGHPGSAAAPADTVGYLRRGEKTGWIIAIFIQTSPLVQAATSTSASSGRCARAKALSSNALWN